MSYAIVPYGDAFDPASLLSAGKDQAVSLANQAAPGAGKYVGALVGGQNIRDVAITAAADVAESGLKGSGKYLQVIAGGGNVGAVLVEDVKAYASGKVGELLGPGWGAVATDVMNGNWSKLALDAADMLAPGAGFLISVLAKGIESLDSAAAMQSLGMTIIMAEVGPTLATVGSAMVSEVASVVMPLLSQAVTAIVNSLPTWLVGAVNTIVGAVDTAVGSASAVVGGITTGISSALAAASCVLVFVGAVIVAISTLVQEEERLKAYDASKRRKFASEVLKRASDNATINASSKFPDGKPKFQPLDFFRRDSASYSLGASYYDLKADPGMLAKTELYEEFLAVESGSGMVVGALMHPKPIPPKERELLCMLRLALMTDMIGDKGNALWSLYVDLIAQQFRLGRVRYATSKEIADATVALYPFIGEPKADLWAYAYVQAYEWQGKYVGKYEVEQKDGTKVMSPFPPDMSDDLFAYGSDPRSTTQGSARYALQMFERQHPGVFANVRKPAQSQLEALVKESTAKHAPIDKSPATLALFANKLRAQAKMQASLGAQGVKALSSQITKTVSVKANATAQAKAPKLTAAEKARIDAAKRDATFIKGLDPSLKSAQSTGTAVAVGLGVAAVALGAVVWMQRRKAALAKRASGR